MTYLRLLLVSFCWLASTLYAQSPVANFTANPLTVCVGQNVAFTNTSSANGGPALSSYQWDFGDGNSATSTNASHAFSTAGTFTITLVATNANGVADAEMVRVFNCGIGMVVIVSPDQADSAIKSLTAQGLKAWTVGEVVERPKDAPQTIVI